MLFTFPSEEVKVACQAAEKKLAPVSRKHDMRVLLSTLYSELDRKRPAAEQLRRAVSICPADESSLRMLLKLYDQDLRDHRSAVATADEMNNCLTSAEKARYSRIKYRLANQKRDLAWLSKDQSQLALVQLGSSCKDFLRIIALRRAGAL
jgi:chromosome condensin MukBEF ATPase and DNA-binding subunit MukB